MAQGCPLSLKPLLIEVSFQRLFPDLSSWRLFPITLLLYNAPVTINIYPKPLSFSTTLIEVTITTSSNLGAIDLGARSFCCEVVLGTVEHQVVSLASALETPRPSHHSCDNKK